MILKLIVRYDSQIPCKNFISKYFIIPIFSSVFQLSQDLSVNVIYEISRYILCREKVSANSRIKREPRGLTLSCPFRPTAINITFYKSQTVYRLQIPASSLTGSQGR